MNRVFAQRQGPYNWARKLAVKIGGVATLLTPAPHLPPKIQDRSSINSRSLSDLKLNVMLGRARDNLLRGNGQTVKCSNVSFRYVASQGFSAFPKF
jgi:hypothetical protein